MMDIVYSKRGYVERENAEALKKVFHIFVFKFWKTRSITAVN